MGVWKWQKDIYRSIGPNRESKGKLTHSIDFSKGIKATEKGWPFLQIVLKQLANKYKKKNGPQHQSHVINSKLILERSLAYLQFKPETIKLLEEKLE